MKSSNLNLLIRYLTIFFIVPQKMLFVKTFLSCVVLCQICTKITPTLNAYSARQIGIWLTHSLFLRNYNGLVEPCFFGEHPYHFATSVCHKQVGHFLSAGGSVFTFKLAHLQGVLVINDILD